MGQPRLRLHAIRLAGLLAVTAAAWIAVSVLGLSAAGEAVAQTNAPAVDEVQVELESITVEPPDREAEILVRRHLPLRVGQVVGPGALIQARDDLYATGLFREAEIYTTRGSRPGAVNVVVAAEPSHRFSLETGLGFEPLGGWYLNIIGVRRTGLFDHGGVARLHFRSGLRASGLYGELEVPGLLPKELDLLVDAQLFNQSWTVHAGDEPYYQDIDRGRVLLGVRHRLRPGLALTLRSGYTQDRAGGSLRTEDDDPGIPADSLLPIRKGTTHYFDIESELVRNRLDPLRPWQNGSWVGAGLRASEPDRGPFFWRAEIDARAAVPVFHTRAVAFRVYAGFAGPGTPHYLRQTVGGAGNLRGFSSAGLSGPLGARARWQASAEWRHPLAGDDPRRPKVIGTIFADIGDHWDADGRRFGLSADVGYGALFRIPWLETVNVEIAYPITDEPTGSPVTARVSLGRSF